MVELICIKTRSGPKPQALGLAHRGQVCQEFENKDWIRNRDLRNMCIKVMFEELKPPEIGRILGR